MLTKLVERFRDRILQSSWAISPKLNVDSLEPPDKIDNFATRNWSTRRGAKVGATSEGPIVVDQAIAGIALEHWTGSIRIFRERFAAGGTERFGRDDRLAFGQVRRVPGQLEMTALGFPNAVPFYRSLRQIGVNLPHFGERGFFRKKISTVHFVSGSTPAMA